MIRGNRHDLSLAKHAVAPGTDELAAALEFEDGMSAAMEHEHVSPRVDGYAWRLNKIPRTGGRTGCCESFGRPIRDQLITKRVVVVWLAARDAEKAEQEQADSICAHRPI